MWKNTTSVVPFMGTLTAIVRVICECIVSVCPKCQNAIMLCEAFLSKKLWKEVSVVLCNTACLSAKSSVEILLTSFIKNISIMHQIWVKKKPWLFLSSDSHES